MTEHIRPTDSATNSTSQKRTYGRYVGRVGALAAALGIGLMVATTPGIASADTTSSAGASADGGTDGDGTTSNADSAGIGTTNDESGATGGSSGTPTTTSSTSDSSLTTTATDDTKTRGSTSRIQLAPGVSISANSIKIGKRTVTLKLGELKPPSSASGVAAQPESPRPIESGETIEPTGDGVTPVVEVPDAVAPAQNLVKAEAKSAHPTLVDQAATSRPAAASTLASISAPIVDDVLKPTTKLSASLADSKVAATARAFQPDTADTALVSPPAPSIATPPAPTAQVAAPVVGFVGVLNQVVTNLLNPFLAPAPNTPEPVTPVVWAVLGWVRRNLVNQAPVINPRATVQTGQTVTGTIGAIDPEGDALTYTVSGATQTGASTWVTDKGGTLTIDQATGDFTYTPNDINYTAAQTDSFTVTVSDGKANLLSLFGVAHTDTETIDVTVQPPTVERVVLSMPPGVTNPANPRYGDTSYAGAIAGESILFAATWDGSDRTEIFEISSDGTQVECLTCGLAAPTVATSDPAVPVNLRKPVPFYDGSGRVVVLLDNPEPRYAIYEPAGYNGVGSPARMVNVVTPDGGGASLPVPGLPPDGIINREREMRPSPDGTHVLFTRIVFGQSGNFQALPIVGELTPVGDHYEVTNAAVVWPTGEGKQWTPDGKGVIIQGGAFEAGNVDDIMVDLSGETGESLYPGDPSWKGTRVTGNLDYDEDIDMSPNMAWITVGSTRGFEALTPMTRIVRQNFVPVYVGAAIYDQYADGQVRNVSNQNWAVAVEDDLNRENGIPLFIQDDPSTPGVDEGDGWISRSMPSWNADGTAVTFWESGNGDEHGVAPTESRLVIANLKYTTSVGQVGDTTTEFDPDAFQKLETYVAKTTPLPAAGTYSGAGGGTATVTDVFNTTTFQTTRTIVYADYVNEDGLILNGTEQSTYGPSQTSVTYLADIDVTDATGAHRGRLDADAVVTLLPTQSVTGYITSTLDGDTQTIPDPVKVEAAKTGA